MKTAFAIAGLLALCACAAASEAPSSYSLGRGVVSYDELRRVGDKCEADGGKIVANANGGDPAQLSNYTCVIPKGKQRP
jgi:hypothetical protein